MPVKADLDFAVFNSLKLGGNCPWRFQNQSKWMNVKVKNDEGIESVLKEFIEYFTSGELFLKVVPKIVCIISGCFIYHRAKCCK